jgi:putative redox protein
MSNSALNVILPGIRGELQARLDEPPTQAVAHALFAHCFAADGRSTADTLLVESLTQAGIAVLRLDFAVVSADETNRVGIAGSVGDLIAAVQFLQKRYRGPTLLIGQGIAGTAALVAAPRIEGLGALVLVNAPSDSGHLAVSLEAEPARETGTKLLIKKQLLDEIAEEPTLTALSELTQPLLVVDARADASHSDDSARRILQSAQSPASLITFDGSDRALTNQDDAAYVARLVVTWLERYLPGKAEQRDAEGLVVVRESRDGRYAQTISIGRHRLRADEPIASGGNDLGPSPYDLLLTALGACTAMTLRMYADRKKLGLRSVEVRLAHQKIHAEDCRDCETKTGKIDRIERTIVLTGDLDESERQRLLDIANRCPVHRTLKSEIEVDSRLARE